MQLDLKLICVLCHTEKQEDMYFNEDGLPVHASCDEMDRSSMFGDWITLEYDGMA